MQHFKGSIIITVIGLVLGYYIGGLETLYIVALLAILEISLSFDNAVVNAKVLETMDEIWQRRFITFGMPIAVFGMRFVFPIVIVAVASGLGVFETFELATNQPMEYQAQLKSVEKLIFSFGGAFLLMVFLGFLFDQEREERWISAIEDSKLIKFLTSIKCISTLIASLVGLLLFYLSQNVNIAIAYGIGMLLYTLIHFIDNHMATNGVRSGLMGLLYLEVLDASFSFDGVIGAFALSSNIYVIMIGLGIGAMFVRSLTLLMLEKKTLVEYQYLEHGAHYAIFALALIMLLKVFIHVNELVVGTVGVSFILVSAFHSIHVNRKKLAFAQKNQ